MPLPLSILDLAPVGSGSTGREALQHTLQLARRADELGYTRYWLAEHHNMPAIASSSPEILIGQVATVTERIRVGSGGVMLPNHAPLKVAENFRTLEALFPGRIDLGIGRAPGTDPITAIALRGPGGDLAAEEFPSQLADLFHFTSGTFPPHHPFRRIIAMPDDVPLPPVWLLGSSDFSSRLAARLGLGYGFAAHFSSYDPVDAMLRYRREFKPSRYRSEPMAILAVSVICTETEEEADYLAATVDLLGVMLATGRLGPLPSPEEALAYPYTPPERELIRARRAQHIVGDPSTVKARILELAERTQADEVMISSMIHSPQARMRSYELVWEAFQS